MSHNHDADCKRPRTLRTLLKVCVMMASVVVCAWLFIPAQFVESPQSWQRGNNGEAGEASPSPTANGFGLKAHLGKLKSNNNTSKASSSSHSDPAYFSARSILLINRSDHLLAKRIGEELFRLLKQVDGIEQLKYLPFGHQPKIGELAPDLFITLDLKSAKHSGTFGQTLDADVLATLGTSLYAANHSYNDHLTPPVVSIRTRIKVDHHSQFTGVESASSKYVLQGNDIAKSLNATFDTTLKEFREKYSPPQVPEGLYPEYREAPAFAWITRLQAKRLTSDRRLMSHNETFWQLGDVTNVAETMTAIRDELRQDGWRGGNDGPTLSNTDYLRLTNGSKTLEVFHKQSGISDIPATDSSENRTEVAAELLVRYQDRMTQPELNAILVQLLDEDPIDIDMLLSLNRYANSKTRERILKLVEADPPQTLAAWLVLADYYAGKKDKAKTTHALKHAHHLALSNFDTSKVANKIKQATKKLDLDEQEIERIDRTMLEELGYVWLNDQVKNQDAEIAPGESAKFFASNDDRWEVVAVHVDSENSRADPPTYAVKIVHSGSRRGRSQSYLQGTTLTHPHQHQINLSERRIRFEIQELDTGRIQVRVRSIPLSKDNESVHAPKL